MIPNIDRVDHIHVFVSDRDASVKWYRNALGFEPVKRLEVWATDTGPLTVADANEQVCIALFKHGKQTQAEKPESNHSTVAIAVDAKAFLAWEQHLNQMLNTKLTVYDLKLAWSVFINDPDGNPYEITCYDYDELAPVYSV
ncbi:VOC family protein [Photobacterium alginatilyticum]|uniref:VOC family protein n=1 Tax=Photobacterium alginatilyticum TaxID=1775171 RepID=A0ABW9YK99_9GAMM|nr:VOC family protein [Photobacterium alginatilyticum]NBI54180.1 VOC family protein [Photobacterium alginatilyticum]